MKNKHLIFLLSVLLWNCQHDRLPNHINNKQKNTSIEDVSPSQIGSNKNTIAERITPPLSFTRQPVKENSFQKYLRTLKLKPKGSQVKYYNGNIKPDTDIYTDVVDLAIGKKDLHQCADAIMRLRAEHLWEQKKYHDIHFNFTNGHKVAYSKWMEGKRMKINGNKTSWLNKYPPSNTYQELWNYLELIFMYAGTASLEKELASVSIDDAQIGDLLIQGGHPGHAVIIVDKAINQKTNQAIFLLAQSYMPAQEIQILRNPGNDKMSPWYQLKEGNIATPEWKFSSNNLKRFK